MTQQSSFKRSWMLVNGFGWLVAGGFFIIYILLTTDWDTSKTAWDYFFERKNLWQVVIGMIWTFGFVVFAAQWVALKQITQLANRWLILSTVGALISGFHIIVLKWLFEISYKSLENVKPESEIAGWLELFGLIFGLPLIVAIYNSPLIIFGLVSGIFQQSILRKLNPAVKAWWILHTFAVVAGMVVFPLGGFVYGWLTRGGLVKALFPVEKAPFNEAGSVASRAEVT